MRLAQAKRDVKRAQKLRSRVFYRDGTAIADAATLPARRDKDPFDNICEAIDPKAALHELPPLIKGYLRLGAYIGDGAVIDHQFGTTDVLIVMPVSAINARYIEHFGADASRHAA